MTGLYIHILEKSWMESVIGVVVISIRNGTMNQRNVQSVKMG